MNTGWDHLWKLFHEAIALPEPERAGFITQACGDDAALLAELTALVAAHRDAHGDEALQRGLETIRNLDAAALLGERVGPYELIEVLGEGGMGVVYAAEQHEPIRRRVALKVIRLGMNSRDVVARFESERQALALMSHPAIAQVFDAGATDDGRPYFVMELVRGLPVTEYCDARRMPLGRRIELFGRILEGIQHAHTKGIIHRDLKPSNILVVDDDSSPQPKIIDFGIAKALAEPLTDTALLTRIGLLVGTPSYMSPEQADTGAADVDTRSDIYSLGVLLYELATGTRPFDEPQTVTSADLARARRERLPPRPSSRIAAGRENAASAAEQRSTSRERLRRRISGDLDWILMKALDPDRERRYASVDEFARDLERFGANEPVSARPPSAAYRSAKFVARHRVAVAISAVIVAATVVGIGGLVAGLREAREARAVAEQERNYAESVNTYLQEMLAAASPYVSQGADTELLQKMLDDMASRVEAEAEVDPRLAVDLQLTMSDTYRALGRLDAAERHADRAWQTIERAALDPSSPRVMKAKSRLALVYWAQGRMEESLAVSRELLSLQERTLGRTEQATMSTLNNIGLALKALQRFGEAEALHREIYDRRVERYGTGHRATLISGNNLANLYRDSGQPEKAEPLMRDIVARAEEALGPKDPDTIAFTDSYGNILVKLGRLDDAEAIHLDVIERMRAVNGADHPDTMGAIYHLGQLYMAREDWALAEEQFRLARDTIAGTLGEDHRYAVYASAWLGKSLMKQHRWQDAEGVLRAGLASARRVFPTGHTQPLILECRLGATLAELGRGADARMLLQHCTPALVEALAADDDDRRLATHYLDLTRGS